LNRHLLTLVAGLVALALSGLIAFLVFRAGVNAVFAALLFQALFIIGISLLLTGAANLLIAAWRRNKNGPPAK
jgi:predicted phage tail protein